jgi:hypothetical protein
MDETLPPNNEDKQNIPNDNSPDSQEPLAFEFGGSILAATHRILQSPAHQENLRKMSARNRKIIAERLQESRRRRREREDNARILPLRDASDGKWPGACSELLPGVTFQRITAAADQLLLEDEDRQPTQDFTQTKVRARAHEILRRAHDLGDASDPDYIKPHISLSFLEMASGTTDKMEKQLREQEDPDTYLAERQTVADGLVRAIDAFNVAALEETI